MLSVEQYADVVEERNIGYLCGYPLCSTPMKNIPTQKYHVSVKDKQVYDLTERKVLKLTDNRHRKFLFFAKSPL